jgi:uncharacterized membrane protein
MRVSRLRLSSIDAIRGLAVILMFFHHFPGYLMKDSYESDIFIMLFIISRFSAPLFLIVVGISMVLSARNREDVEDKNATVKHYIKRGFLLLLGGAFLNVMTYTDPMKLNILYTIGLSLIFLSVLAVSQTNYNSAASILAVLFLSEAAYLFEPAKNVLAKFDFPLLPWIIFPVYGIILGGPLIRFYKTDRLKVMVRYLQITAVLMMALTAAYVIMRIPFEFQDKATLPFICLVMALTAYILSLSVQLYEISKRDPRILKPLKVYGRFALPTYFIHHVFVITIPHILGLENSFSLNESMLFLAIFLVTGYIVLEKLEKSRKQPF